MLCVVCYLLPYINFLITSPLIISVSNTKIPR